MVVNDFDLVSIPFCPNKADTPQFIDSNAPLPLAIFLESLQMIGRRWSQVVEGSGNVERDQFSTGTDLNTLRKFLGKPTVPDLFRFLATKG